MGRANICRFVSSHEFSNVHCGAADGDGDGASSGIKICEG